ncbi:MAG TPA: EAL domain-containing protein [Bacilli bacterium]
MFNDAAQSRKNDIDIEQMIDQNDFYHVVQPIIRLQDKRIIGFEALLRSDREQKTDKLFSQASSQGQLFNIDTISLYRAMETFEYASSNFQLDTKLFLNVFPSTLLHSDFSAFMQTALNRFSIKRNQIVIELNETYDEELLRNIDLLCDKIDLCRSWGFLIALDDVGVGAADIKKMIEFAPDFIKLDRYFSENLAQLEKKQMLLNLMVQFCSGDSSLILEGIEREEDMLTAQKLGIEYGQGYYLGYPECPLGER